MDTSRAVSLRTTAEGAEQGMTTQTDRPDFNPGDALRAMERHQPILWLDRTGQVRTTTPGFSALWGKDATFEVSGPAPWAQLAGGEPQNRQGVLRTPDGRRHAALGQYLPIRDADQRVTGIALTVTPRAPAARPGEFAAMIDLAPAAMALLDADFRLVHCNGALAKLLGRDRAELMGRALEDLVAEGEPELPPADCARLQQRSISLLQIERRLRRGPGETRNTWAQIHLSHVETGGAGDQARFVAQFQDVSEQREVQHIKSNFVATVSHELRTPLTSIKGALGMIGGTMTDADPSRTERLLSIAVKNCDRLTLLVNDILDMEKISSGQSRFHLAEAPIWTLLEQAEVTNQPFGREHGVAFALSEAPREAWVRVDVERFQQVMSNLMSNAAKFSPDGSTVMLSCGVSEGHVTISVTDCGPGIAPEFREKIFMPFSQADDSSTRAKGGTGLGLNITRQIVERMGGEIGFENHDAGGCTFWVRLPEIAPTTRAEREIERIGDGTRRPMVLHVEHDRDFAEVLRMAFDRRAVVTHAVTMAEAAWYARQNPFDLVLIDWDGIQTGGTNLLNVIEAMQPGVPIYGLSTRDAAVDPRVRRNLIKSRVRLEQMVDAFAARPNADHAVRVA